MVAEQVIQTLGHALAKRFSRKLQERTPRLLSRLFPIRPEELDRLKRALGLDEYALEYDTDEEGEAETVEIDALTWFQGTVARAELVGIPLALAGIAMVGLGAGSLLRWLQTATRPAVVDPAFDSRGLWTVVAPALLLGMSVGWVPLRLYLRRRFRGQVWLYDIYKSWKSGYDETRALRALTILFLVLAAVLGVGFWNCGKAVDANGILVKHPFARATQHGYGEVVSVERYDRVKAPIGIVDRAALIVRFRQGPPLSMRPGKGQERAPQLDKVAAYVSEHAGVPIIRGDVAPKP